MCGRVIVEGMVKEIMELKKLQRADHVANIAKASVRKGGCSYKNLDRLIKDINLMKCLLLRLQLFHPIRYFVLICCGFKLHLAACSDLNDWQRKVEKYAKGSNK